MVHTLSSAGLERGEEGGCCWDLQVFSRQGYSGHARGTIATLPNPRPLTDRCLPRGLVCPHPAPASPHSPSMEALWSSELYLSGSPGLQLPLEEVDSGLPPPFSAPLPTAPAFYHAPLTPPAFLRPPQPIPQHFPLYETCIGSSLRRLFFSSSECHLSS